MKKDGSKGEIRKKYRRTKARPPQARVWPEALRDQKRRERFLQTVRTSMTKYRE